MMALPPHAAVDVKPEPGLPAKLPQLRQRIDHPAAVVPAVPTTMKGAKPFFRSSATRRCKILDIHLQIAVRRDDAERPSPEPGHVRDLVEPVMGLCLSDRSKAWPARWRRPCSP